MDREQTIRILKERADEMRELGVIRLAIFGSVIRDQDRSDSDVDLLVDIDEARRFSLLDHVGLTHFFEDVLGRSVDVVRRQSLKPFLRDAILAEAVEIYPQPGTLSESVRIQPMPPRSPRQRLEDIREAIVAAETFTARRSLADYRGDRMLQLALERNVEIISEASRHIPENLRAQHPGIPWRKVRDIGNVFRHGYETDPNGIWLLVTEDLAPLKMAVEAMIEATKQSGP